MMFSLKFDCASPSDWKRFVSLPTDFFAKTFILKNSNFRAGSLFYAHFFSQNSHFIWYFIDLSLSKCSFFLGGTQRKVFVHDALHVCCLFLKNYFVLGSAFRRKKAAIEQASGSKNLSYCPFKNIFLGCEKYNLWICWLNYGLILLISPYWEWVLCCCHKFVILSCSSSSLQFIWIVQCFLSWGDHFLLWAGYFLLLEWPHFVLTLCFYFISPKTYFLFRQIKSLVKNASETQQC